MTNEQTTIDNLVDIIGDLKDELAALKETVAYQAQQLQRLGVEANASANEDATTIHDSANQPRWEPCSPEEAELYVQRTELH